MAAPIQTYEYLAVDIVDATVSADEVTQTLNSYGADGWRLITIYRIERTRAIFIREATAQGTTLPAS